MASRVRDELRRVPAKLSFEITPSTWADSAARPIAYDEFGMPATCREAFAEAPDAGRGGKPRRSDAAVNMAPAGPSRWPPAATGAGGWPPSTAATSSPAIASPAQQAPTAR